MKIGFICGGLEPGCDGVGDYTRRLAGELVRQGHSTLVVALNDSRVSETVYEPQEVEGTSVSTLRLSSATPWSARWIELRNRLDAFGPDWISLQFVPFGFHPKGLCFGLGKRLASLNRNASWHIMFHELWLGLGRNCLLKHRLWGALQRYIVVDLLKRLRPRIVNTHADSYRTVLAREGVNASILPLFSNIPYIPGDAWNGLLEPLIAKSLGKRPNRMELYLVGVFGAVPPEWNGEQVVNTLAPLVEKFQKRLVLLFYGRNGLTQEAFHELTRKLRDRACVVLVGERSSLEISRILQTIDLAVATTPRRMIQKSGSSAAIFEHGLQLLVIRDDWQLRGSQAPVEEESSWLISPSQFVALRSLPVRNLQPLTDSGVKRVADRMIAAMNTTVCAGEGCPA